MLATVESPPARRRRRGYLRAVVLAPLVFLMGLGLSFAGPAAPAYASATDVAEDLADMVIAGGKKAAPAVKTAAVVGSRLNPASLAVTTLAWAAWETSDIWLPWAADKLGMNGTEDQSGSRTQPNSCGVDLNGAALVANGITGNIVSGPNCWSGHYSTTARVKVTSHTCKLPSGSTASSNVVKEYSVSFGYHTELLEKPFTMPVCAAGDELVYAVFNVYRSGGIYGVSSTPTFSFGAPYPETDYTTTTTQECKLLDGTIVTISRTITGHSGVVVPSCEKAHPGSIPWTTTIKGGPTYDPNKELTKITHNPDVREDYPDCFDALGTLQCKINVWVDGTLCRYGDGLCADWHGIRLAEPERVQCKFGAYAVPLAQCDPLKRAYTKVHTVTKPGPNGEPELDPDAPSPTPTPTPTPTLNPTPPPSIMPTPTIGTEPPQPPNPDQPANCLGEGWTWNPVSWVYVPIKCAAIWAFVPKTSVSVRVNSIKGTITGKAPFSWFSGFAGVPAAIPDSGCPDWTVTVAGDSKNIVCGHSSTEYIRAARPVLLIFMGALALWPLIRSTAYAAFPIIKPAPGMLR